MDHIGARAKGHQVCNRHTAGRAGGGRFGVTDCPGNAGPVFLTGQPLACSLVHVTGTLFAGGVGTGNAQGGETGGSSAGWGRAEEPLVSTTPSKARCEEDRYLMLRSSVNSVAVVNFDCI